MKRLALMLALGCAGCEPELVDRTSLIEAPRIIAVIAEPPEAPPSATVQLKAVVAGASDATARWSVCSQPRPFSQNQAVDPECVSALNAAPATGETFALSVPSNVCRVFGPDAPSGGVRPREPDATGGYYQPVGVELDAPVFAFERLSCVPAGVSFDVAQAYRQQARPNLNPVFQLTADSARAGASIEIHADWSGAPEERFVMIDPVSAQLVTATERYDVTWFVSAGEVGPARSSSGTTLWTLPAQPGDGTLWAVLRDSRGGVAVQSLTLSWR
ncbi:MAG: hypothetical protein QM723_33430 [Myxococcaceae bacterium]